MPIKAKQMKGRGWLWLDSREHAWWAIVLALLAVLGAVCWLALFFGRTDLGQREKDGGPNRASPADSPRAEGASTSGQPGGRRAARVVYAYSVIPGGVRNATELKSAITSDPVVSAAYAGFRLEDARVTKLDQERSVHLAYRVGSRVFWTSKKITLERGETVITDGAVTARTKCGNLISEEMQTPVSPDEPVELALNTPIDVRYDPGGPESDDRLPELSPPPSPSSVPPPSYETPIYSPPYFGPPVGGSPWSGGGEPVFPVLPPPPFSHPQGSPPPSPPVISTPEPGTGVQLLLGAAGILFLLWRRKARGRLEASGGTR